MAIPGVNFLDQQVPAAQTSSSYVITDPNYYWGDEGQLEGPEGQVGDVAAAAALGQVVTYQTTTTFDPYSTTPSDSMGFYWGKVDKQGNPAPYLQQAAWNTYNQLIQAQPDLAGKILNPDAIAQMAWQANGGGTNGQPGSQWNIPAVALQMQNALLNQPAVLQATGQQSIDLTTTPQAQQAIAQGTQQALANFNNAQQYNSGTFFGPGGALEQSMAPIAMIGALAATAISGGAAAPTVVAAESLAAADSVAVAAGYAGAADAMASGVAAADLGLPAATSVADVAAASAASSLNAAGIATSAESLLPAATAATAPAAGIASLAADTGATGATTDAGVASLPSAETPAPSVATDTGAVDVATPENVQLPTTDTTTVNLSADGNTPVNLSADGNAPSGLQSLKDAASSAKASINSTLLDTSRTIIQAAVDAGVPYDIATTLPSAVGQAGMNAAIQLATTGNVDPTSVLTAAVAGGITSGMNTAGLPPSLTAAATNAAGQLIKTGTIDPTTLAAAAATPAVASGIQSLVGGPLSVDTGIARTLVQGAVTGNVDPTQAALNIGTPAATLGLTDAGLPGVVAAPLVTAAGETLAGQNLNPTAIATAAFNNAKSGLASLPTQQAATNTGEQPAPKTGAQAGETQQFDGNTIGLTSGEVSPGLGNIDAISGLSDLPLVGSNVQFGEQPTGDVQTVLTGADGSGVVEIGFPQTLPDGTKVFFYPGQNGSADHWTDANGNDIQPPPLQSSVAESDTGIPGAGSVGDAGNMLGVSGGENGAGTSTTGGAGDSGGGLPTGETGTTGGALPTGDTGTTGSGTTRTANPDGTFTVTSNDGSGSATLGPDGTVLNTTIGNTTYNNQTGSSITQNPDGSVTHVDSQGNETTISAPDQTPAPSTETPSKEDPSTKEAPGPALPDTSPKTTQELVDQTINPVPTPDQTHGPDQTPDQTPSTVVSVDPGSGTAVVISPDGTVDVKPADHTVQPGDSVVDNGSGTVVPTPDQTPGPDQTPAPSTDGKTPTENPPTEGPTPGGSKTGTPPDEEIKGPTVIGQVTDGNGRPVNIVLHPDGTTTYEPVTETPGGETPGGEPPPVVTPPVVTPPVVEPPPVVTPPVVTPPVVEPPPVVTPPVVTPPVVEPPPVVTPPVVTPPAVTPPVVNPPVVNPPVVNPPVVTPPVVTPTPPTVTPPVTKPDPKNILDLASAALLAGVLGNQSTTQQNATYAPTTLNWNPNMDQEQYALGVSQGHQYLKPVFAAQGGLMSIMPGTQQMNYLGPQPTVGQGKMVGGGEGIGSLASYGDTGATPQYAVQPSQSMGALPAYAMAAGGMAHDLAHTAQVHGLPTDHATLSTLQALITQGMDPDQAANAMLGNHAGGGQISHLGDYSDGGRLLKGPGDGMSDNIPAMIGHKQPARLADGEFVIPADVVSHLGNGSTDAGAKVLYKMMERVRKARTGNPQQGNQINSNKFMPR